MRVKQISVWIDGNGNARALSDMDEDHLFNVICLSARKIIELNKASDIAWSPLITEKIEEHEAIIKAFVSELERRDGK